MAAIINISVDLHEDLINMGVPFAAAPLKRSDPFGTHRAA
jgi:hypothetical protein